MEHESPEARRPHGELVSDVMAVLWAADSPMTPQQVNAALERDLARTTVATILIRLHEKGTLTRVRSGRGYAYAAADDAAGLVAGRMRRELDTGADRDLVLQRFVSSLSEGDEDVLRRLLRQAEDPGAEGS
ncbi:BlaI/MecI/CopY family transcriptional regulator [Kitasatospora sp. NPDC096147]|uniref:BlaI/MecI/CopY family transcriptional regulator n=1 Tax=Kitasatospora sp. NPDC096147 TaxID=3364093 RepID=UPI003819B421